MTVSSGPVSQQEALDQAAELEQAIDEVMRGERKPGKLPVEPMVRLIQFARDSAAAAMAGEKGQGSCQ